MREPGCPICAGWHADLAERPCDVTHLSRLDAELHMQDLRALTARFYAAARPHGRWRKDIPKNKRINPRTTRKHERALMLMYEGLLDALIDAPATFSNNAS